MYYGGTGSTSNEDFYGAGSVAGPERRVRSARVLACTCTRVHVYLSARVLALVERRHGLDEQSAVPPDTDVTRVLEVHQPAVLGPDDHWVHGF